MLLVNSSPWPLAGAKDFSHAYRHVKLNKLLCGAAHAVFGAKNCSASWGPYFWPNEKRDEEVDYTFMGLNF